MKDSPFLYDLLFAILCFAIGFVFGVYCAWLASPDFKPQESETCCCVCMP